MGPSHFAGAGRDARVRRCTALHVSTVLFAPSAKRALALSELRLFPISLNQIPKFGIVLVLVVGALGFRDRKETDLPQLILFC